MSVLTWLEQRTGIVSQTTEFLTEDVPGGASYWYVFGSATIFAMILQFVTGIFLTFYYAPSASTAWESTNYIYHNVPFGGFVIGLHFWGATAMIALMFMHLLQVLIWGAYKAPREIMWVIGVILLILTLVLGLTGYLLPWDMNAYFASQVAINIAASTPLVGSYVQQFLSGGAGMGTLTINRFFGLHVWLMPALLALLAVGHLVVFRHNGSAGPPVDTDLKKLPQGRFWPNQMFMDAVASFAVFAIMVLLAIFAPPALDAKADPTQQFIAYPAWYFLALYGLLRSGRLDAGIGAAHRAAALDHRHPGRARYGADPAALDRPEPEPPVEASPLDPRHHRDLRRRRRRAVGLQPAGHRCGAARESGNPGRCRGCRTRAAGAQGATGGPGDAAAPGADAGAKVFAANCAGCHGAQGAGVPGAFPPLAATPTSADRPTRSSTSCSTASTAR